MPDEDVTLTVTTRPQEPAVYAIRVVESDFFEIRAPGSATAGQIVEVTVLIYQPFFKIGSLLCNDEPCTYLRDDGAEYRYEFTMPAEEVTLTATIEEDLHPITPSEGEHSSLIILNCLYNQGTPEQVYQASQFTVVRFLFEADLGYDIQCVVRTESGDELPYAFDPADPDYGACYTVEMPDQPITIATVATEKSLYQGKDFVGSYRGFELHTAENPLITGISPSLAMELRANGSFAVTSADRNAFDFDGMYVYDEAADRFTYERASCRKTYAVSGRRLNGDMFIQTNNLLEDRPDNNRYYFTSKDAYEYACASPDHFDRRFLIEIRKSTSIDYYYVDLLAYTWNRVEAVFDSGTTIAGNCSALIRLDGTPLLRYTVTDNQASVFVFRGSEAGTYRLAYGTGPDLVLDGFGRATVGDVTWNYTVEKGIVTCTSDGTTVKYLIDTDQLTYYQVQSDQAWNGAANLYAESTYGYNSDVSSSWITGWVYLDMDCDMQGNAKARYARIRMTLPDLFGRPVEIISDDVPYLYDPQAGTLVLSQVAQGRTDGWGQVRRDIAFTVTEQKTVVFTTEKVASMSSPNQYIYTLGLELSPAPDPAQ